MSTTGDQTREAQVESFAPTNGRVTGWLGAGLCVALSLFLAIEHVFAGSAFLLFAASLVWASMIRPGVGVTRERLHLRNMVTDTELPLEGVRSVIVRRFLAVGAGGKRYSCPAISRPLRGMIRGGRTAGGLLGSGGGMMGGGFLGSRGLDADANVRSEQSMSYPDYVEDRITQLATEARERRGIESGSDEEFSAGDRVRRRPAWLPIALLGVTALGFVIGLLV